MGFLNNMIVQSGQFYGEKEKFSGDNYATFQLKVTESVYDKSSKGNNFENRYWDFKVFGKTVDTCRDIIKGSPITVYGELDRISTWEKDGEERFNVSITASRVSKCPKDFSDSEPAGDIEEEEEDAFDDAPTPVRRVPPPKSSAKEAARI